MDNEQSSAGQMPDSQVEPDSIGITCMPDAWDHFVAMREKFEVAPSARKLNRQECQRCGYCCLALTCIPRPEEIQTIADFLNLTVNDLAKRYMVVDQFGDSNYFLRWGKKEQDEFYGTLIPEELRMGDTYCVFFDEDKKLCRIHQVRPQDAQIWKCWDVNTDYLSDRGIASVLEWGDDDIYRFLPEFKPEDA